MVGPNLLHSLANVLVRWQRHRYVLAVDVEKMYRQVLVHPGDRNLQRIIWRYGKHEAFGEYRLNTYGKAYALFLALRTLRQLADDEREHFPRVRQSCSGTSTWMTSSREPQQWRLQRQRIGLRLARGFPLRKWAANAILLFSQASLLTIGCCASLAPGILRRLTRL